MVASDNVTPSEAPARGQAQSDETGKAAGLSGAVTDVTRVKAHEEALRRADASLREALAREQTIFDTAMGHRVGDEVLCAVAARLRSCIREADMVARHGGDEFVVLVPELHDAQDAVRVAEKIIAGIEAPILVEDRQYRVGASIGIAVYPGDAQDADTLLRYADQAMYSVKRGGGNGVRRHVA